MSVTLDPEQRTSRRSVIGELVRLGWMLFGFNGVLLAAVGVASRPAWTLEWRDALYWGVVLATAALRYLDIAKFDGETAGGRPATMGTLWRYLAGLFSIALVLWIVSQSVDL